jgi:uncharacterized FlaG/YvyC family protein
MQLVHTTPFGGHANNGATAVHNALRGMTATSAILKGINPDEPDMVSISETGQNLFEMEKVIANLREYAKRGNYTINFEFDDETGSLVVRIVDRDTGEVMRQIPPDEILALRSHLQELLKNVFAESA